MKTLSLTVLVFDGPIARAYLSAMESAGFSPQRIVLMVPEKNPATGKIAGRWLPRPWRTKWAEKVNNHSMFHWPRVLHSRHHEICVQMAGEIGDVFNFATSFFDSLLGRDPLEKYCSQVDRIVVDGLSDKALWDNLQELSPDTILFTGGGIVPAQMLALEGLHFLHVHPGFLPMVRGADGLLWSYLTRKKPGASCFYMTPGLDVGDVIVAQDLPRLAFPLTPADRPDDTTLYRLLFTYLDPAIRAHVLLEALKKGEAPFCLPSQKQDTTQGVTYHFMNPELKSKALQMIFPRLDDLRLGK